MGFDNWPQRHKDNPRCMAQTCDVTDPAQLVFYMNGLACEQHKPRSDEHSFRPQPRTEIDHVPQPVRVSTARYGLLPVPKNVRRRAKRG